MSWITKMKSQTQKNHYIDIGYTDAMSFFSGALIKKRQRLHVMRKVRKLRNSIFVKTN